ncbi:DUF5685 family protein [Clostridium sp. BJN0001]|uniref:DUF5685 family protein n=1 Tax=Clostridium sp. BJN0001 TaxID=2930219 RepID=UPI001FD3C6E7|nr:DUF5685 family protein [Clostridium sp. BJN0001]
MFGYVTPLIPELKVKDYERFKCYYCGLCIHLKENFGNIPRLALNYDMTFLGILLDALSSDDVSVKKHVCILHPFSKKVVINNNKALLYAASMNVALFYYKLTDDYIDDKDILSKIKSMILSPYERKFSKEIDIINSEIKSNLLSLQKLEKNKNFNSLDEISDPFSKIVGIILKYYPYKLKDDSKELRNTLYNLGYCLGKFIYIVDALDDLEDDIKRSKFNPIQFLYNKDNIPYKTFIKQIKDKIDFIIYNCGYTINENLINLKLYKNKDILYNIIELGLMDKYKKITNHKTNEHKRSDSNESL